MSSQQSIWHIVNTQQILLFFLFSDLFIQRFKKINIERTHQILCWRLLHVSPQLLSGKTKGSDTMKFSQANIFYLSHAKSQTVLPALCKHLIQISLLKHINHFYNFNVKHQPYSFMLSIKISRKGDPEALNVCSLVNSALLRSPHNKVSLWIYWIFLGM